MLTFYYHVAAPLSYSHWRGRPIVVLSLSNIPLKRFGCSWFMSPVLSLSTIPWTCSASFSGLLHLHFLITFVIWRCRRPGNKWASYILKPMAWLQWLQPLETALKKVILQYSKIGSKVCRCDKGSINYNLFLVLLTISYIILLPLLKALPSLIVH